MSTEHNNAHTLCVDIVASHLPLRDLQNALLLVAVIYE